MILLFYNNLLENYRVPIFFSFFNAIPNICKLDQLSSAEDQIEKLTKELRIERNLRQEAEKAQNNS